MTDEVQPVPVDAELEPVPGTMLVERCEQPLTRGAIILPEGYRSYTRSSEAIVRFVAPGVTSYRPGDRVLLSTSVGRTVSIGPRAERKLLRVTPHQVLARVQEGEEGVVNVGRPAQPLPEAEVREYRHLDEGTPGALR